MISNSRFKLVASPRKPCLIIFLFTHRDRRRTSTSSAFTFGFSDALEFVRFYAPETSCSSWSRFKSSLTSLFAASLQSFFGGNKFVYLFRSLGCDKLYLLGLGCEVQFNI